MEAAACDHWVGYYQNEVRSLFNLNASGLAKFIRELRDSWERKRDPGEPQILLARTRGNLSADRTDWPRVKASMVPGKVGLYVLEDGQKSTDVFNDAEMLETFCVMFAHCPECGQVLGDRNVKPD